VSKIFRENFEITRDSRAFGRSEASPWGAPRFQAACFFPVVTLLLRIVLNVFEEPCRASGKLFHAPKLLEPDGRAGRVSTGMRPGERVDPERNVDR
jgi:hypothetical protein